MAQRPTSDFDIDPNITSGTDLANILNRFQDAIDSGNSGASRPAYLAAGGMWVKEGNPMRLYLYDGTKDIELYNTTDGIVGAIEDGKLDGQITTWDVASGKWTPDGTVFVKGGNVGIGTNNPLSLGDGYTSLDIRNATDGAGIVLGNTASQHGYFYSDDNRLEVQAFGSRGIEFVTDNAKRMSINAAGNTGFTGSVGIGIEEAGKLFHVKARGANAQMLIESTSVDNGQIQIKNSNAPTGLALGLSGDSSGDAIFSHSDAKNIRFFTDGDERMHIGSDGRVGIGGQPSRSAEEVAKEANDTLAGWKSIFDERLKADPKADKKAVTLEITGNEFDAFPSEKVLIEKLTARNIGGGDAKLQVAGDGYFTGEVNAAEFLRGDVPVVDAKDIVQTLSTLREATRDETTLEGLRDALSDAIGGLIQKFEAQISTTES